MRHNVVVTVVCLMSCVSCVIVLLRKPSVTLGVQKWIGRRAVHTCVIVYYGVSRDTAGRGRETFRCDVQIL